MKSFRKEAMAVFVLCTYVLTRSRVLPAVFFPFCGGKTGITAVLCFTVPATFLIGFQNKAGYRNRFALSVDCNICQIG
jgi:hypothetical protein